MLLTRAKFEQMVEHLIDRCRKPVMQALNDSGYKASDIDEVVLVGGMTRMPRVQQLVKEIFGKEGHKMAEVTDVFEEAVQDAVEQSAQVRYWKESALKQVNSQAALKRF